MKDFLRKHYKKFIIGVLSLACACSFVGCKGDDENSAGSTPDSSSSQGSGSETSNIEILLSETNATLLLGDEFWIKAEYTKFEDAVPEWTSSNPAVASVDATGKVVALLEGSATITVSYLDKKATCEIVVERNDLLPTLHTEGLSEDTVSVSMTDTLNVTPTILFNGKTFTDGEWEYKLSDSTIGTVENGEFKPLKAGTTTLTIMGKWRGVEGTTLTKVVEITVIDSISVVINGGLTNELFLYTAASHGGKTYATTVPFEVSAIENEKVLKTSVSITKGEDVISYDVATETVTALTYGSAELTVTFTDSANVENSLSIPVTVSRPVAIYEDTVEYFSAVDGVLPVAEIFGADVTLLDAYQGEMVLTVEDNLIFGVETEALNVTETQITIYNETVGYLVKVEAYKKVIDEESDLAFFNTDQSGYVILKNDIECQKSLCSQGTFTGVFNGNGYALKNPTFSNIDTNVNPFKGGVFGCIGPGAVIKNVAFKDANLAGYNSAILAGTSMSSYYVPATVENIYVSVKKINSAGRPGTLFWDKGAWDYIRNVIVDLSAVTMTEGSVSGNTYGALFGCDKWAVYNNGEVWKNSCSRINGVYVIAAEGTPMMCNTAYGANTAKIWAGNDGKVESAATRQYVYTGVNRYDNFIALANAVAKVGDNENYWTISELGIEWKGELPEVETVEYEKTIKYFSAMDGELPIEEIFGTTDVVITDAYQNGSQLKVENNKIFGVATLKDKMTETQVVIFTAKVNYILNLEAYTKVIDEESDLAAFDATNGVVSGYFILKNDVVCAGEKEWKNVYNTSVGTNPTLQYFDGTLDGNGHKIVGMKVGENGLLGCLSATTIIKDIAFTETVLAGGDWKNTALLAFMSMAGYGSSSAIENVYIHIADFRQPGGNRAAGLLYLYNAAIKINNVVMVIDSTEFTSTPQYGYGALFEHDREKGAAANLTNVYVVSAIVPLAMHRQEDLATGEIKENVAIYASNDKDNAGKFEGKEYLYYAGVQRYDDLSALSGVVTQVGNWAISASGVVWTDAK